MSLKVDGKNFNLEGYGYIKKALKDIEYFCKKENCSCIEDPSTLITLTKSSNKPVESNLANKYMKKPMSIEAIKLLHGGNNIAEIKRFLSDQTYDLIYTDEGDPIVKILTLEGTMLTDTGDYLIRGIKGEVYPCKCEIFEKSYLLV